MALVEEGAAPSEQQTHHRNGHRNRQQQHYTLATCYLLPPTYHPPTTHLPPTYYPPTTHLLLTYYPIPGYTTYKLRVAIYYHHCYEASVAKKTLAKQKTPGNGREPLHNAPDNIGQLLQRTSLLQRTAVNR